MGMGKDGEGGVSVELKLTSSAGILSFLWSFACKQCSKGTFLTNGQATETHTRGLSDLRVTDNNRPGHFLTLGNQLSLSISHFLYL